MHILLMNNFVFIFRLGVFCYIFLNIPTRYTRLQVFFHDKVQGTLS
uniref:Uncharacterized protein n=1 Tax=Anguilla anguilla TaxID=7936 RepID=A0A0E9XDL7_ANGAN